MHKSYSHQNLQGYSFARQDLAEVDFSFSNLKGANFSNSVLTRANFDNADIRGARFTNAILTEANFSSALAGLQRKWVLFHLLLSLVMAFASGVMAAFASFLAVVLLMPTSVKMFTIIPGISVLTIGLIAFIVVISRGLSEQAFGSIAGAGAGAVVYAIAAGGENAIVIAITGTVIGTTAVAITAALIHALANFLIVTLASIISIIVTLLNIYVAWQAWCENPKYNSIRKVSISIVAISGTTFQNADLTAGLFHSN